MQRSTNLIASLTCIFVLIAGNACTSVEAQIKELESQKQSSQQLLDTINKNISSLQSQSNKLTNELRTNHNQTIAFVRDHPGVVACIASGTIAMDDDNVFSDDIKNLGEAVGLICLAIYIGSEDFQKSVDNFLVELKESSDREKNLQAQIDAIKPKTESETRAWKDEKVKFDALTEEIEKLRAK